ncbi:putative F-box protein [Camellia lanceoleosa]|uniref:F-box protein n=1 Tax=Camellia lanceoleosa TaxID=1840588 RepID=A0ACC0FBK9_9ERIC|nr:putative F-box protein [Camellia lanceoleosa]
MGPCNGIFCLLIYADSIALWNPANREFRALPRQTYPETIPPRMELENNAFGFGMDPFTDDYKVVSIRMYWDSILDDQYNFTPPTCYLKHILLYICCGKILGEISRIFFLNVLCFLLLSSTLTWMEFTTGAISLGFCKNGEILIQVVDGNLVLADPITLEMKELGTVAFQAFIYHESLVSVQRRDEELDHSSTTLPLKLDVLRDMRWDNQTDYDFTDSSSDDT